MSTLQLAHDPARTRRRSEARFLVTVWLLSAATIFWGFAQSYFLRRVFSSEALPLLLHLHGLLMSAWVVLFVVQVSLVVRHRVRWHRRLGVAGVILATLILLAGALVAINGAHLGHVPRGVDAAEFLFNNLLALAMFAGLVVSAVLLRHRPDYHKRLMLLATLTLVSAAAARLPVEEPWRPNFAHIGGRLVSLDMLLLYATVTWDTLRHRRLHPAFGWGLVVIVLTDNLVALLPARTAAWHHLAAYLMR